VVVEDGHKKLLLKVQAVHLEEMLLVQEIQVQLQLQLNQLNQEIQVTTDLEMQEA
tara:strand:+ start:126 stop:290 length:165 start_codon:yes stop_codon:yes gene_type:complete